MNMRVLIIGLIVVIGVPALLLLNKRAKERAALREELLTILGDVALDPKKLDGWWSVAGTVSHSGKCRKADWRSFRSSQHFLHLRVRWPHEILFSLL